MTGFPLTRAMTALPLLGLAAFAGAGSALAQDEEAAEAVEAAAEIVPTLPDAEAMRARVQQKVDSYYNR